MFLREARLREIISLCALDLVGIAFWIAFDSGARTYLSRALFSTTLYLILILLPLVMLIFWLVRVRLPNAYNRVYPNRVRSPNGDRRLSFRKI